MPEDRASGKKRSAALAALVSARESSITFDNSWIVDVREIALLPNASAIVGAEVTPLVVTPGCIFLTDQRLYFQPFNNVTTDPVLRYNITDIQSIYKVSITTRFHSLPSLHWIALHCMMIYLCNNSVAM
jgi:hypothetical protein